MIFDNFHLQSTSESHDKIERIYRGPKNEAAVILAGLTQNQITEDGYLDWNSSKATTSNQDFDVLSIVSSKTPLNEDTPATTEKRDYDTVFELDIEYIPKPLESATKYKCTWNYDLYHALKASEGTPTSSPVLPSNLDEITKTHGLDFPWMLSQTQPSSMQWKGDGDAKEELYNWFLVLQRSKPGQEDYYYPRPIVTEKIYFSREKKAVANLAIAGKIKAPKETFGYGGEWLVMPDGVRREGKYYVTINMYKFADKWDRDLYDEAGV